jgi:lipopolysaccharide/colanic/teichoic acid biosynthesis glycosyltransferase
MYSADVRTNLASFSSRMRSKRTDRGAGKDAAARSAEASPVSTYYRWKGAVSRIVAAMLFVPGALLALPLMLLVRISSPGPVIFAQRRVGQGGRVFTMYKLRTMRHDAEVLSGPVWATDGDPRITRVGWVLRKLHLDELPQLVNVLRGEMDLFGPRPERPEFVEVLSRRISGYERRLAVRPGVSGLAQINLPPDTDLESVRRKLVLDEYYIRSANPLLDARMFACTLLRMMGVPGNWAMHALGLDYSPLLAGLIRQGFVEECGEPVRVPTPWRDHFDSHKSAAKYRPALSPALALGKASAK